MNAETTETKIDEKTPSTDWANWALRQAWYDGNRTEALGSIMAERLHEIENGPRAFVVCTDCGHWARGATLVEAVRAVAKIASGRKSLVRAWLAANDKEPFVDSYGTIHAGSAGAVLVTIGTVGTVGSILGAQKQEQGD